MPEFEDDEDAVDGGSVPNGSVTPEIMPAATANPLITIVKESGLEQTKADIILNKFKDAFAMAAMWEKKSKAMVVTSEDQEFEMQQARAGRLLLRKKRLEIEETRKKLKEQALREGKAIDGIANVLKALIVPIEEHLDRQERFVELKAQAKAEAERLEAERIAEEERVEKERFDVIERDRRIEALPYREFWKSDNPAFRDMSEVNFENMMIDLQEAKNKKDQENKRIAEENARIKEEAAEREVAIRKERAEADKKLAAEKAKADAELKASQAKAEIERQKQIAEIAKKNAELARAKEIADKARAEQEKIQAENARRIEAERKKAAELAEKLKNMIECPKCKHKFTINKESHGKKEI